MFAWNESPTQGWRLKRFENIEPNWKAILSWILVVLSSWTFSFRYPHVLTFSSWLILPNGRLGYCGLAFPNASGLAKAFMLRNLSRLGSPAAYFPQLVCLIGTPGIKIGHSPATGLVALVVTEIGRPEE